VKYPRNRPCASHVLQTPAAQRLQAAALKPVLPEAAARRRGQQLKGHPDALQITVTTRSADFRTDRHTCGPDGYETASSYRTVEDTAIKASRKQTRTTRRTALTARRLAPGRKKPDSALQSPQPPGRPANPRKPAKAGRKAAQTVRSADRTGISNRTPKAPHASTRCAHQHPSGPGAAGRANRTNRRS